MPETNIPTIAGEEVTRATGNPDPSVGTGGIPDQLPGKAQTVSNIDGVGGGNGDDKLTIADVDAVMTRINNYKAPLYELAAKAKTVVVTSPEVDHYMIDSPISVLTTTGKVTGGGSQAVLPLPTEMRQIPRVNATLSVTGVPGYKEDGATQTNDFLTLYVTGYDPSTRNPIVIPVNGKKNNPNELSSLMPDIPEGTRVVVMSTAMSETQKYVAPSMAVPAPTRVYLQKTGMTQVVSDYFNSQKKRIPFTDATLAEAMLAHFKKERNHTHWISSASKFKVVDEKTGSEIVYTTKGVRWQFRREMQHRGDWTLEKLVSLSKMYFTGPDAPESATLLAGKDLTEKLQNIDYKNHPEVSLVKTNLSVVGWVVSSIQTTFGSINIVHDPTLDEIGYSHSGALIAHERLVRYARVAEHSFEEQVEGREAKRKGVIIWDAIALKGLCHIWIDGEGSFKAPSAGVSRVIPWSGTAAPKGADLIAGAVYFLLNDAPEINAKALEGQTWKWDGSKWSQYHDLILGN